MAASTFSYAQAAKGISTPVSQSKPASGVATPAKDISSASANGPLGSVPSWADDAESESVTEHPATNGEVQPQVSSPTPAQPTQSVEDSSISSPDLGASASSASTVTKDDDVSSLPNASSESTWDNKSQASTSVDKSVEPAEKTSEKVKKGKNAVVKPLQEAPVPAVNIWKKRADELKSKIQKPSQSPIANGVGASTKKSETDAKAQSATGAGRFKSNEEDRSAHIRKDSRAETDSKKDGKTKSFDKDVKSGASAQLPPPKRDQESWPTPETVINEDRKKAQEKGEKEQKESAPIASHGKHEWVKVPYTPSVVFNTPLPNATGSRRGGRPSGRGGAQPGGRPTTYGGNQPEKDGSAPVVTNGDHTKRERPEGAAPQDAFPKTKRTGSAASPTLKDQVPTTFSEKPAKANGPSGAEPEFRPRTAQSAPDSSQAPHHGSTYPRQHSGRPNKPRRGDMSFASERRRDGEVSPAKDNTFDSAATQTEAHADGERRHSTYHEGPNGHQHKQGRFGSYGGGRERGRGGGRGGRGNYANGHQYSSGHMSAQSTPSFSLGPRSPTTFHPENPSFFAAPQGKYGRNGHRSQSVTTDQYRFAPYQAGPPVPPIQTYGMYDYSMMQQPMSAVPYAPYVDQFALMAMLTTQVYVFRTSFIDYD
jgi:la-related protein 1